MKHYKVIHIPYTAANPYQKLLMDNLKAYTSQVEGANTHRLRFLDISILYLLRTNWKPNIIHLHWHHSFLLVPNNLKSIIKSIIFVLQLLLLKILRVKLIWTVHNITHHETSHQRIEIFFASLIARLADAIIAHCQTAKHDIQRVFNLTKTEKINVIPHGSYLTYYKNSVSQAEARKQLKLGPDDFVFVSLGEIRAYKGLLELVNSFKSLNTTHEQKMKLLIAGRPYEPKTATELVSEAGGDNNICIKLAFLSDNEIQVYTNAADILIFPYRKILTSGAVLLALSFGKPIIAPRLGCIKDTLDSLGSFVYDPNSQEGLINAMEDAIACHPKLAQMGEHNQQLAKALDWSNIARSTHILYQRCLGWHL